MCQLPAQLILNVLPTWLGEKTFIISAKHDKFRLHTLCSNFNVLLIYLKACLNG